MADRNGSRFGVVVTTLPVADAALRVHVDTAIRRLGHPTAAALEAEIRLAYPSAAVRPGDPLGSLGGPRRWYVYREGRPVRSSIEDRWWADDRLPATIVDENGRYVHANRAAAALFGVRTETVVGSSTGSFTRHEHDPEVSVRLFEVLRRTGELQSTAIVVRPDGVEIPIEFHMRRIQGDKPQYVTVMRPTDARDRAVIDARLVGAESRRGNAGQLGTD